ncbi:MAG TPA: TetR family transcriptional regulator [Euzebyales bacterium]|nr:TetR family transcriptional regulator [Euzebyales bacterium]
MAPRTDVEATTERPRIPLSRGRVLRAAVDVADRGGLEALTMRRLAQELGVEAMSLYHHVANKEAVLDGVIEVVVGEILEGVDRADAPAPDDDWQSAMRARIVAAREVLLRHPWAPRLLETRTTMSPMEPIIPSLWRDEMTRLAVPMIAVQSHTVAAFTRRP